MGSIRVPGTKIPELSSLILIIIMTTIGTFTIFNLSPHSQEIDTILPFSYLGFYFFYIPLTVLVHLSALHLLLCRDCLQGPKSWKMGGAEPESPSGIVGEHG